MKLRFTVLCLIAVIAAACGTASPDPGQEAVLVKKPIVFGHGGVDPTPVRTGLTFTAWTTTAVYVPTIPIQFQEHFDDLMSADGVPLDFDASMRLKITDSVTLVDKFGVNDVGDGRRPYPQWYAANIVQPFRTAVRQEVRLHGMNETAISTVAVDKIDRVVSKQLADYIKTIGLPVELLEVTIGKANPPDAVKTQRMDTAAQEQRANTERQKALAEEQRLVAETKRAAADNAYRNAMNMSPEQFLQLEAIKAQRDICAKGTCTYVTEGTQVLISK